MRRTNEPLPQRVTFDFSLKVTIEDVMRMKPEQAIAILEGVGRVRAAVAEVNALAEPLNAAPAQEGARG